LGSTWPNPSVGAVLVEPASGRILATGATQAGGRPHAEPVALKAAGAAAAGATLYVSLEPCSHVGKSPPCTEAILASRVGRVVTALEDPDERVAGQGHAILRHAGVALATGVLARCAARDHRGHVTRIRRGRPAVTVKLARTSDGFAARTGGDRLLITGEGANARTHMMRAHSDAVMVGVSTVVADDPRLDVRLPGLESRSPVRIVLDSGLRSPPASVVVATARKQATWIVCTEAAPKDPEAALLDAGAAVIRVPSDGRGRADLGAVLKELGLRGLTRILCEGGPALAEALAERGLVDELILLTGEAELGEAGLRAVGPYLDRLAGSEMAAVSDERVGRDRIQVYERDTPCSPVS
ncbi:MAG: ribD, partial [Enterovirga sp.]|nr:ribD [Enterovirga sp.]